MASIKFHFAVIAAKISAKLIKLIGGNASNMPGQIATKLCKDFLDVAPKAPLVVCVTGTNGKTTVTNLLTDAFEADGKKVASNRLGSNIKPGCATNVLNSLSITGKCKVDVTVFEVDERASRLILPYIKPDYLAVTNLFRDSLKRNAHPDYIFSILDTYCPKNTKMILNSDDLCSSMLGKDRSKAYYGIAELPSDIKESVNIIHDYSICPKCATNLEYDYLRYHHIGHATCPNCGFHSFDAKYLLTNIDKENKTITIKIEESEYEYPLISDILFNIYNELTVIATLYELGFTHDKIYDLVSKIQIPDSRFNETEVCGIKIVQTMSKGQNSVATSRNFDYLSNEPGKKAIVLAVDDLYDRKKSVEYIGWIYDVDYEFLNKDDIVQIVAAGPRCYDHKVRLLLAGVPEEKISCATDELESMSLIKTDSIDSVYMLYDTYTYDMSCKMKEKLIMNLEESK